MKKFLSILFLMILGLSCIGLVACQSGDPAWDGDITGTYKLSSVYYEGQTYVVGTEEANAYGFTADTVFMVITEDTASITNTMISESYTGTWVLDGTSFIMTVEGDSQTFILVDDTITINGEGEIIYLKKI